MEDYTAKRVNSFYALLALSINLQCTFLTLSYSLAAVPTF
jgi:hypothetical protein